MVKAPRVGMSKDDGQSRLVMSAKLRSPSQHIEPSTMDSFQDGGQPSMHSEQSDYPQGMDGAYINSDVNNYGPGPGDPQGMGGDGYGRMGDGLHPGQMPQYNSYNRAPYNMGDGPAMSGGGSGDYPNHNSAYGQFSQSAASRGTYSGVSRPGMSPVRPGMPPQGMGMMPSGYNPNHQRMVSGQSISQQSGPTPTLNQLLQTPNSGQRYPQNSFNDFGGGTPQKGAGQEMGGPAGPYGMSPSWSQSQRGMGYPQMPMSGASQYRGQIPSHFQQHAQMGYNPNVSSSGQQSQYLNQQQASSSSSTSLQQQPQPPGQPPGSSLAPQQQSQQQPTTLNPSPHQHPGPQESPQQRPTPQPSPLQRLTPNPSPGPPQRNAPQASPSQPRAVSQPSPSSQRSSQQSPPPTGQISSPSQNSNQSSSSSTQHNHHSSPKESSNSSWDNTHKGKQESKDVGREESENSMELNSSTDDVKLDNTGGNSLSSAAFGGPRAVPSPGSAGSRSNTPATLPGSTAGGSPMPPRPPSQQHLDGQQHNPRMSQSPMSAPGYSQQMMPPPLGPNQMGGYGGPGGKMGGMGGGSQMTGGPYPPYNSQYPQGGNYPGRQPGGPGMAGNFPSQQNMYNGPSNMSGNHMYNNMSGANPMSRSNYSMYPGQQGGMMNMSSQYGNYGGHMGSGPGAGPPQGSGQTIGSPGPTPANGPQGPGTMNSMGQGASASTPNGQVNSQGPGTGQTAAQGAQAAAQAALIAAASSAGGRSQANPVRPAMNVNPSQRMYTPQNMPPHSSMPPQSMSPLNHMNQMNHVGYNSTMNSMNSMPANAPNQQPQNSLSPVPNAIGHPGHMGSPGHPGSKMPNNSYPPPGEQPLPKTPKSSKSKSAALSASSASNSVLPPSGIQGSMPSMQDKNNSGSKSASPQGSISSPPVPDSSSNNSGSASSTLNDSNSNVPSTQQLQSSSHRDINNMSNSHPSNNSNSSPLSSSNVGPASSSDNKMFPPSEVPSSVGDGLSSTSGRPSGETTGSSSAVSVQGEEHIPITTTANTTTVETTTVVTQSITSPVTSISTETGNSNDSQQLEHLTGSISSVINCIPVQQPTPTVPDEPPEKKKKESSVQTPTSQKVAPSPGGTSNTSLPDDIDNMNSPGWPSTPKPTNADYMKLYEMGMEPDRKPFLDRLFAFLDDKGSPITGMPCISKQPLDLYRLYLCVREKGGMVEVTKAKKWKEICGLVNIGCSASAAFTLKKNYIKYMFAFECRFDRGGIDPAPILAQMEAQLQQKREAKQRHRAPSPAGSQGSQDAFRPPSTPNSNSQGGPEGYPGMAGPNQYMQNNDPNMGHMGPGMMPNMMNSMGPHGQPMMNPNNMGGNMPGMSHHMGMSGPGGMQGPGGMMMPGNMPPQGQMMPGNSGYMMPNNGGPPAPPGPMMGNNMAPHQGGMMGPAGPGMQGQSNMMGNMPPQTGMMAGNMSQSNNMMGNMTSPPNSMMGGSNMSQSNTPMMRNNMSQSMGQSNTQMMPHAGMRPMADSVTCQDPFADEPSFPRPNTGSQIPPFSGMNPQPSTGMNSQMSQMPPHSSGHMPPSNSGMPPNSAGVPPHSTGMNTSMPPQSMGMSGGPHNPNMSMHNSGMTPHNSSMPSHSSAQGAGPGMAPKAPGMSSHSSLMPVSNAGGIPLAPSQGGAMPTHSSGMPTSNSPMPPQSSSIGPSQSTGGSPLNSGMMPPHSFSSPGPAVTTVANIASGTAMSTMNKQQSGSPFQPVIDDVSKSNENTSTMSSGNRSQPSMDSLGSSQFSSGTTTTPSSGRQFPFGDQFTKPERFDQPAPNMPQPNQQSQSFPPAVSAGPTISQMSEGSYPNRYGPMPSGPDHFPPQTYPGAQPGPGYQHKPNHEPQYTNFPNQQSPYSKPPMGREMYSTPNKRFPDNRNEHYMSPAYNSRGSMGFDERSGSLSYPGRGFSDYGADSYDSHSMAYGSSYGSSMGGDDRVGMSYSSQMFPDYSGQESGHSTERREGHQQWPMNRPHGAPAYGTPGYPHSSPQISHMSRMRMSPQRGQGGMPQKQKMGHGMHGSHMSSKKDMIFPPDSVESTQPLLSKRRRLTKHDIGIKSLGMSRSGRKQGSSISGQIEAWRLMMALKSGLLAESTWALDTLTVLLFDDSTVAYFSLAHLPGLLEVLLDHFRRCLMEMFNILDENDVLCGHKELCDELKQITMEGLKRGQEQTPINLVYNSSSSVPPPSTTATTTTAATTAATTATTTETSTQETTTTEKKPEGEVQGDKTKNGMPRENYTLITRQGKEVKFDENAEPNGLLDDKLWDLYSGFGNIGGLWEVGKSDITEHIKTHFADSTEHSVLRKKFFRKSLKRKLDDSPVKQEQEKSISPLVTDECEGSTDTALKEDKETSDIDISDSKADEKSHSMDKSEDTNCYSGKANNNPMEEHSETEVDRLGDCSRDKSDSGSVKSECGDKFGCDKDHTCNNFIASENIKSEPRDPELDKTDSRDSFADDRARVKEEPVPSVVDEQRIKSAVQYELLDDDALVRTCKNSFGVNTEGERGNVEDEAYQRNEPPLCLIPEYRHELGKRCVCISNIFRSLSCIPGNDTEMSQHAGLIFILGKLLLLHHKHLPRSRVRRKFDREDVDEDVVDTSQGADEWWWDYLSVLRENTFVILANICAQLRLDLYPDEICKPTLEGLLHWVVCPSSCATDPLPTTSPTSVLSPLRLVLEAMCKLCIHERNVDMLLATPPYERIVQLFGVLTKLLANRSEQVTVEFSIVLLSELVQGGSSAARGVALQQPCISLLIDFLETADQKAMQVVNMHGINMLRDSPEMMGTSLDMLRRAATVLLHLARVPNNRKMFIHQQSRLLSLVMSQILDQTVAQILSDVLFQCSESEL